MNKVYIVVGTMLQNEVYSVISKYGVKSTIEKAQKELEIVKNEILENEKDRTMEIKEKNNGFEVIYDNDDLEIWQILERVVDDE